MRELLRRSYVKLAAEASADEIVIIIVTGIKIAHLAKPGATGLRRDAHLSISFGMRGDAHSEKAKNNGPAKALNLVAIVMPLRWAVTA